MGGGRFMGYNMMQHGPRSTIFASWTRASSIDRSDVFCMLAKFYREFHLSAEPIDIEEFVLRLRGP